MKNLFVLFFVLFSLLACHGTTLNEAQAVHAIMGESSGECYQGKLWVACIIRNRHSLKGIYGANVSQAWLDRQPLKAKRDAIKAWHESQKYDVTHGCMMFGNLQDDHYFIGKLHLKPFRTIGHQRFYK